VRDVRVLVNHGRVQQRQCEWIPGENRNVGEHITLHRGGHGGGVELNRRQLSAHRDRFRSSADLELRVDRHVTPGENAYVLLEESDEARGFNYDRVRARLHKIKQILSGLVGLFEGFNAGVHISEFYGSAGNGRRCGIRNDSLDPGPIFLRVRRTSEQTYQGGDDTRARHKAG
jgi:hypothetical protein